MRQSFPRSSSIQQKYIRLLFIMLSTIIMLAAAISWYSTHVQHQLMQQQQEWKEKAFIVASLEETIDNVFLHARGYYAFRLPSELEQVWEQLALFDSLIDQFSETALTEQEQGVRDQIRAFHTQYTEQLLPETIALTESGDLAGLQQYTLGEDGGMIAAFLTFAENFRHTTDMKLEQAHAEANSQIRRFMLLVWLFAGLALCVFLVLIWRILREIIGPLSNLSRATEAIIHGEMVHLKDVNRDDEIGRLSTSFQHMVQKIQDKEEELTAQNEELITQQEELQSNQEQLQRSLIEIQSMTRALDQSSAVAIWDEHGVLTHVNDKLGEWTGYKVDELLGKPFRMLLPTIASSGGLDEIMTVTASGGIWNGSRQHRKKDGQSFWMDSTVVPYVNPQGNVYQCILIGNNISRLKQTELKLVDSLKQTEKAKETLERHNRLNHALTYTLDKQEFADVLLHYVNELYPMDASLFLLTDETAAASNGFAADPLSLFRKNNMDGLFLRLARERSFVIKREANPVERGIAGGSVVFGYDLYTGIFDSNDRVTALFGATRIGYPFHEDERNEIDGLMNRVSLALERIMMFHDIEKARKLNKDILNNVNEVIQFVDADGRMVQHNEALYSIVDDVHFSKTDGVEKEAWTKQFAKVSRDGEMVTAFFEEALDNHSGNDLSFRYAVEGETVRYMEVYASSICQHDEKIGTIFVHRDMTKEYELDQMKSELVSTVSHELRTPLSSVLGFAELLLSKTVKPERQRKYVETIYKEAKRLTELINDFLDLQRMELGKQTYAMEACALNRLVLEVIEHFKHEHKHHAIFLDEARDVHVRADRDRMIQVFTNLFSNAVKFSPQGGRIILRLANERNDVIFSIQDEGMGMPRDELPKLFQKFKRIDNSASRYVGGTGLGLAICKEIITSHHGEIWIESEEGAGTTVFVRLPILSPQLAEFPAGEWHAGSEQTAPTRSVEDGGRSIPGRGNVMIVEDDASQALLLAEELKSNGFRVIHHYHPESALKGALQTPLVGMVIDLMLGQDLDGWDLIKALKEHPETESIPIVVSSALDMLAENAERFHIEKYLTKPYPPGDLSKVMLALFSRSGENGAIAFPNTNPE